MAETDRSRIKAEHHQAGAALRERIELLRVLEEHVQELVIIRDLDARTVYASPSVVRFYGRPPATLFEFAHPDDVDDAHSGGKAFSRETPIDSIGVFAPRTVTGGGRRRRRRSSPI